MRIAKYMAQAGVASRRKSEELIAQGSVRVNGKVISEPGTQVEPGRDNVTVNGRKIKGAQEHVYIMLNKPVGCVSTCTDDKGRKTVLDYITGVDCRVYPVGRLDFTTEGLLLLTNDGDLAYKLTHPRHEVTKRYLTIIDGELTKQDVEKLQKGVFIDGGKTAPARIKILRSAPNRTEFTIIIHEGRNHQVKRMLEAVEKNVVFLKRISEGDLNLGELKSGAYRFLTQDEISYLKKL